MSHKRFHDHRHTNTFGMVFKFKGVLLFYLNTEFCLSQGERELCGWYISVITAIYEHTLSYRACTIFNVRMLLKGLVVFLSIFFINRLAFLTSKHIQYFKFK